MKKMNKVVLGIATFWPILYLIFFSMYSFQRTSAIYKELGEGMLPPEPLFPIWPHIFTIVLILTLLVIYIIDVFKNNRVKNDMKAVWTIILFVGNVIAMPIYWYLYIWKSAEDK